MAGSLAGPEHENPFPGLRPFRSGPARPIAAVVHILALPLASLVCHSGGTAGRITDS